jgi:hypothetical protein
MRGAFRRSDGTVALEKVNTLQSDLQRYMLFRQGMSVLDIARQEGADPKMIERSVKTGRGMYEGDQQIRLRDAKYESAIENEKIRNKVRTKVADKLVIKIDELLEGKRPIVETDKLTGLVTIHEITDPDVVAMGIEAAMTVISLKERPMPNQTIVNIQNNQGDGRIGGNELTFEERIERIHGAQMGQPPAVEEEIPAGRQVIEVEGRTIEAEAPVVEEDLF